MTLCLRGKKIACLNSGAQRCSSLTAAVFLTACVISEELWEHTPETGESNLRLSPCQITSPASGTFFPVPFIFWLSSQKRLMWFTGGVDCSSLGLFLWAQRRKYVSKNKKKQRKRIGDVSRNYEWKKADLSSRLIGNHKCSQRGWNTKGNMLQAAGRGRDWLPAGGTKEVGWRWEDEAARLNRAVDGGSDGGRNSCMSTIGTAAQQQQQLTQGLLIAVSHSSSATHKEGRSLWMCLTVE